jgi:diguanylate cyclase
MLQTQSLMVINAANMLALAFTLPIIMGRKLSPAAIYARNGMVVQAGTLLALLVANARAEPLWHTVFSTLSVFLMVWAQWLGVKAIEGWLGPRQGKGLLVVAMVVAPIGYVVLAQSFHPRAIWATSCLVLELTVVCWACLHPQAGRGGNWRWGIFGAALAMALASLARIGLMVFYPGDYTSFMVAHPVNVAAAVVANVSLVISTMATLVAWRQEAEAELEKQAMTDALTGLANRHAWGLQGRPQFDTARRHDQSLTLVMLDLDHFKRINDSLGHLEGDRVLRTFGATLQVHRRSSDIVARMGGEEFALLLPQTDIQAATLIEQRIREDWEACCRTQLGRSVGYSAGLAQLGRVESSLEDLMARADAALYQAKTSGRGRALVAGEQ